MNTDAPITKNLRDLVSKHHDYIVNIQAAERHLLVLQKEEANLYADILAEAMKLNVMGELHKDMFKELIELTRK